VGAEEEGGGGAADERAARGQRVQHEQDLWQVREYSMNRIFGRSGSTA